MNYIIKRIFFILLFALLFNILILLFFKELFLADSIIITFSVHPFDLCKKYPDFWNTFKKIYIIVSIISSLILSNYLLIKLKNIKFFKIFFKSEHISKAAVDKNINLKENQLNLLVGTDENNNNVYIPHKGLFQNILVTGTIGSGKTSSMLYPFSEQIISFKSLNEKEKISMLILDVKGNFYKQVLFYCQKYSRLNDVIIIELGGKYKYNPLDKPLLKPQILANRLISILSLFSNNTSDSYWLDKAEQTLTECIKLCRLYNDNYVTFEEIHKLIMNSNYYKEKICFLKEKFIKGNLSKIEISTLSSIIDFFQNEFYCLDSRVLSIIKSEISRITNVFISDPIVKSTFCPNRNLNNFKGFKNILDSGKIVILNMNISEYSSLSKIIAAYLKLDFQSEVLSSLSYKTSDNLRISCFLSDEYHEYVTSSDANFFAQSREAKCINILATQSYTSLLNTLNNDYSTKVIIQNLVNKFWFRTDDIFTIEEAQKQIGRSEKIYTSNTISENAKETSYSHFTNSFISHDSNISESINTYKQLDFTYDTNFFTLNLETFSCLSFISTGSKILPPLKIKTIPYFKN